MTKIWYTSDLHFGHVNILKYAPQRVRYLGMKSTDDVTEMNERIVALWNDQVDEDDIVMVIGDVAMGRVEQTIEYVRRLNGEKHLLLGNHDKPHPIASKSAEKRERWEGIYRDVGFESMYAEPVIATFDGIVANMNHFPYYGDHSMDRYNADDIAQFVPVNDGRPLVHGHVHDIWQTNGPMFNVGIDAWDGEFQTAETISTYFRSQGFGS